MHARPPAGRQRTYLSARPEPVLFGTDREKGPRRPAPWGERGATSWRCRRVFTPAGGAGLPTALSPASHGPSRAAVDGPGAGLPAPLQHGGRDFRPVRRGGRSRGLRRWGQQAAAAPESPQFFTSGTSSAPFLTHVSASGPAPPAGSRATSAPPRRPLRAGFLGKLRLSQQSWTKLCGTCFILT